MLKKFCHDQVKILLERMDTNPEEFAIVEGKWDEFMPNRSRFNTFTKVEQYLIRQKFTKIIKNIERQETYDAILETLVFKEETKTKRYYSTSNQPVLGTPPIIYEATADAKTGKITEKITRIKSK